MEEKTKSYGEALSKLIQVETVSASNHSGRERFHAFHAVLKECFPLLFSVCEAEDFSGSLMLRWQGSNAHKTQCYRLFKTAKTKDELRRALKRTRLPGTVRRAVEEALLQTDA